MLNRLIVLLAVAGALPGLSFARGHTDTGFYLGAGAYVNLADLDYTVVAGAGSERTVQFGNATLAGLDLDNDPDTTEIVNITDIEEGTQTIRGRIVSTADDDEGLGFGVHGGYKINKYFAAEIEYSTLGEFVSNSNLVGGLIGREAGFSVRLPNTQTYVATDGDDVPRLRLRGEGDDANSTDVDRYVFLAADERGDDDDFLQVVSATSSASVDVLTASAIGKYPLEDTFVIYGRLGYYSADVTEDPIEYRIAGEAISDNARTGGTDERTDTVALAGTASYSDPLLEDTTGFVYGGGAELTFGRNKEIIIQADFQILPEAFGTQSDITRLGVQASWKF